jgi:hypothetical protein
MFARKDGTEPTEVARNCQPSNTEIIAALYYVTRS